MKPVRASDVASAAPFDGRGHGRTPAVQLLIDERNTLIREAAPFYPGCSDREIARRLRSALAIYRAGRWRRDRVEATCPPQHRGKLTQTLWLLLKTMDRIPAERTVTAALALARSPRATPCSPSDG
jgi:hypothetical protein